jgi:hypothetical protein
MLRLDSKISGKRAALWTGIAPSGTRAGVETPALLPGGGILTWIPPRPLTRVLPWITKPAAESTGFSLLALTRAAGIPLLRDWPEASDPPLALRILERDSPVTREEAALLCEWGAWIDVVLSEKEEIALSGDGIRLAPAASSASLLDVAPTALHLLGLAVPRNSDGRVLYELLDPRGPGLRAPRYQ